ncbi:hypothetical protein ACFFQF_27445 [Haladaptatus pallidirubidus]|uniref:hypothetical protein n=1 Tax=Haladaptatus pallidirubidus TaxID=1008152 RepID=UPI0035F04CF6
MSNTTVSGAASTLDGDDLSVSDFADHVQMLTDRINDLEAAVTEKDEHIADLRVDLERKDARITELEERVANQRTKQTRQRPIG